jgi:hypothetical protein
LSDVHRLLKDAHIVKHFLMELCFCNWQREREEADKQVGGSFA